MKNYDLKSDATVHIILSPSPRKSKSQVQLPTASLLAGSGLFIFLLKDFLATILNVKEALYLFNLWIPFDISVAMYKNTHHCITRGYFEDLGIINMHLNTFRFGGVLFGGFEGCVRYKTSATAPMYTQEECTKMIADFPKVDVFLSHCPPFGINDDQTDPRDLSHVGFIALLDYLEKYNPLAWFHGHTYPNPAINIYKNTLIYYIDGQGMVQSGQLGVIKI